MSEREEEVLDDEGKEQGFLSHLFELRDRLLRCVLAVVLLFACLFAFSEEIYTFLADPLLRHLPEGASMIAIDVASPFLTPFKLVLMLSIFIAVPFILSQVWGFIAPGLYKSEKRLAAPLLVSSTLLFYCGVAFAYYVVFPLVFGFFTAIAPVGVEVSTDIARYLDFVITIFFAFGIAFEVPIAVFLLVAVGLTTPEALAQKRPYFIVAAFVVGMFLTPPDVISQTLLALPMWLLFEFGIIFSRILLRKPKNEPGTGKMPLASQPVIMPPQSTADVLDDEDDDTEQSGGEEFEFADDDLARAGANDVSHADAAEEEYTPLSEEEMDAELDRIEAREGEPGNLGVDIETDSLDGTMLEEEIEEELARIREEDGAAGASESPGKSIDEEEVIKQMASDGIVEPLSEEEIATELERIKDELDDDSGPKPEGGDKT